VVDLDGQYKARTRFHNLHSGKIKTVRLLIEHGADVRAQDGSLMTPLHLASFSGIPEIVRLLLERDACVTAQDKGGRTPLHLASSWVSVTVVTLVSEQCLCEWTGHD
jgi:ankyrin repeat protein